MILCQTIIKIIPTRKVPYKPAPLLLLLKCMNCNFFPEKNLMHKKNTTSLNVASKFTRTGKLLSKYLIFTTV